MNNLTAYFSPKNLVSFNFLIVLIGAALLLIPGAIELVIFAFSIANGIALISWTAVQLSWRWFRGKECSEEDFSLRPVVGSHEYKPCTRPFFSVHIPAHNEPSDMVMKTVTALASQCYENYEVIVIDNNTADQSLWRPVERLCVELGNRFTFIHEMQVSGAKAGALNITRALANPDTTHIVTVDADYQVSDNFLSKAAKAIAISEHADNRPFDYLQYPQAYRCEGSTAIGLSVELTDYFDRHAVRASEHSAMLLTGTLSVISIDALDFVGGWPINSVTEDAELGMRLQASGFRGQFINSVCGRGLLPPDMCALRGQRHRWIVGNLQTLFRSLTQLSVYSINRQRAMVSQLTAWCSFILIPVITIVFFSGKFLLAGNYSLIGQWCLLLASVSIVCQFVCSSAVLLHSARRWSADERIEACLIRWSLSVSSSWSTLSAFTNRDLAFLKTTRYRGDSHREGSLSLLISTSLLALAFFHIFQGQKLVGFAVGLVALVPLVSGRANSHMQAGEETLAVNS